MHVKPNAPDAVRIASMHADHFFDLVGFRYGSLTGGFAVDRTLRGLPGGARLELNDPQRAAREARTTFGGPVERVLDGKTYDLSFGRRIAMFSSRTGEKLGRPPATSWAD
jgi:hypothetical protein